MPACSLNQRTTTAEGNETALATNLLAPYLLTQMLLPRLRESAPSRIINVSSGGMYATGLALDDLQYEKAPTTAAGPTPAPSARSSR